jgi:hypothetical protein
VCTTVFFRVFIPPKKYHHHHSYTHKLNTKIQCIDRGGGEFLALVKARVLLQEDGRVAVGSFSAQPLPPSHHNVSDASEGEEEEEEEDGGSEEEGEVGGGGL